MRNPQGNTMTRDEAALVLMAICVEWPDSIPEGYEDSGREALWMAIRALKEEPEETPQRISVSNNGLEPTRHGVYENFWVQCNKCGRLTMCTVSVERSIKPDLKGDRLGTKGGERG
jgi:hypothetical protein